jgi:hypothetical protein
MRAPNRTLTQESIADNSAVVGYRSAAVAVVRADAVG